ncbi:MAG: hypothetical protein ACI97B_002735 [Verrucomicrobiales bacterium]
MDLMRRIPFLCCVLGLALVRVLPVHAESFDAFLQPLFAESCIKCHGAKKVKGKVNLEALESLDALRAQPELIKNMLEAVEVYDMPPDDEPELAAPAREQLLATLRTLLKESASAHAGSKPLPPRRLNRFQYSNALRDLFQLKKDVFPLPEKLMTRHGAHLQVRDGRMAEKVQVSCNALLGLGGFAAVPPYPKDPRAHHGFDNQGNQLTLSPLLLESYLRLSVAIVESPDFTPQNVGTWNDLFADPAPDEEVNEVIRKRLDPFMQRAFRMPVEADVLDRYTTYTLRKLEEGMSFVDSMKKGVTAILCSPFFLYRYDAASPKESAYELASRLSFFLWGSSPDDTLLDLAASSELVKPEVLHSTIDRMLIDPKIERFLDSFPAQWMQLENLFGVAPDPNIYPQFSLEGGFPATVHMVLEPLLLFDAVFVEDRPVIELIKPDFAYQSDFLKTWYTGPLKPSEALRHSISEEHRIREENRVRYTQEVADAHARLYELMSTLREPLLEAKRQAAETQAPVDLHPYAVWDFQGDLSAAVSDLNLTAHGPIVYEEDGVVLDGSYLESSKLPIALSAKTLEVWCTLKKIKQRGGGLMTIQSPGGFDSIVYGERKPMHWISGSEGHVRTQDFAGSTPETEPLERLHLVLVYQEDGTTSLYRNGHPYGEAYKKGAKVFPKGETSVLFGLRHLPKGGNKQLSVLIHHARLYDRALSAEEVGLSGNGAHFWVSDDAVIAVMSDAQKAERLALIKARDTAEHALKKLPALDPKKPFNLEVETQRRYDRMLVDQVRSREFKRVDVEDPRYGGVITTAATLTMTSAPKRTLPIARGAWMIEVIFNDPPPPPPNDVPPLNEDDGPDNLTIREKFAKHREHPDCAGCHARIDPLGFALENFDITGRWRDRYENNRDVDASGTLMKKYDFAGIVDFKASLVKEDKRFVKAFTAHLLRFALARELEPADALVVEEIVAKTESDGYKLRSLMREVILCDLFLNP